LRAVIVNKVIYRDNLKALSELASGSVQFPLH
jgi:hypothetical protein